ncbi:phenylalanine 4-monooxygenase [Shewanella youngdeokensis]|uniref:Phenylalanine-4-hydroxylase n=1 Tax=Shewanella youngdeokensis TaxID=2999068 RepID=A0ABZ0K1E6_9GAMM|nr:phenylalanine 4-monooxygenase [Shewanella sp. DAU334]
MSKETQYQARLPDANGFISYSRDEHAIWAELYSRQLVNLPGRASDAYLEGIKRLGMPSNRIPQLAEIDAVLTETTGWKTAAVPALISFANFFELLANKSFPVATFIRCREDLDYLQEPDIFHEVFGHCPLLTNPSFARFSHLYGQLGLSATKEDRVFLARLYWFTVEFGVVSSAEHDLKIYGGGILSSPAETLYVTSGKPEIRTFDLVDIMRTPYRIDIMQPIYYAINDIAALDNIGEVDIMAAIKSAKQLGLFTATYPAKSL